MKSIQSRSLAISLLTATLLFTACSGGGDSSTPSSSQSSAVTTGTFVDDPVIGLNYTCENNLTGITNDAGEYSCPTGEDVTFYLGAAEVGTLATQSEVITPYSFFPGDNDSALNLARLLQTVDDGSVSGKLKLDSLLKAKVPVNVDFSDVNFDDTMQTALGRNLIDEDTASANMNEAILNVGGSVPTDDNYIPIANAGEDIFVEAGNTVNLDATQSSDADGESLTYRWELTLLPEGSNASLVGETSATPSFTADVDGRYVAQVIVNDGTSDSSADSVRINTNITEYNELFHSVTTGASNDTVSITKKIAKDAIVDTGAGEDTITIERIKTATINTGADNDSLTIARVDSGVAQILTGTGNDTVTLTNVSGGYDNGSVNLGDGNDTLTIHDSLSGTKASFDGGDGYDTLNLTNVTYRKWGEGIKNIFTNFELILLNDITLDPSNVTNTNTNITAVDGDTPLETGSGDDEVSIEKLRDTNLSTGEGNDTVVIQRVEPGNAHITTGDGDDNLTLVNVSSGYDHGSVRLGDGDDSLTIHDSLSGTKSTFNGGPDNDHNTLYLTNVSVSKWNSGRKDLFTNFDYIVLSDGVIDLNNAPVAEAQTVIVDENSTDNAITVSGSDADGNDITYILTSDNGNGGVSHGTLSGTLPDVTYTPDAYFSGVDTFTFKVNDRKLDSTTVTVTIEVTQAAMSISHNDTGYNEVLSPETGRVWLDRNLGADKVCTDYNEDKCYGDQYQWGRNTDGHEQDGSTVSDVQATDVVNVGHDSFIARTTDGSDDWASTIDANGSLRNYNFSSIDASSVCPVGFRVPTIEEISAEVVDGSTPVTSSSVSMDNFLRLPASGVRSSYDGAYHPLGRDGRIWSNTVSDSNSSLTDIFEFTRFNANVLSDDRSTGYSVRCIKHVNTAPVAYTQSVTVEQDSTDNNITLIGSDVDPHDVLTYAIDSDELNSTVTKVGNVVTYTPNAGFSGSDSFTFFVNDGTVDSVEVTINVTVNSAPDDSLLTASAKAKITGWINNIVTPNFELLSSYDAVTNNVSVGVFMQDLRNKPNILIIARLDNGNVIGGYTASASFLTNGYNYNATADAFLYNLNNSDAYYHSRFNYMTYSTTSNNNYGPTFGGGHDLYIGSSYSGYCNIGLDYGPTDRYATTSLRNEFCGSYNGWTVVEMKAYQVTE